MFKALLGMAQALLAACRRIVLPPWGATLLILLLAGGIFLLLNGNWNRWESDRSVQSTDDAYVKTDVTAVGTKASGLLEQLLVNDYQPVKAGQLIAVIRADDYQAQQEAAQAALDAAIAGLAELHQQEAVADTKIIQAAAGIQSSEGLVQSAQAGISAASATINTAGAGLQSAQAQMKNATEEMER